MSKTRLLLGGLGVAAIVGGAAGLWMQHATLVQLREEKFAWQSQASQMADLAAENEGLSNQLARLKRTLAANESQLAELPRLRAEVQKLRREAQTQAQTDRQPETDPLTTAARAWAGRANRLQQRLAQAPDRQIPELQFLTQPDWFDAAREANLDSDAGQRAAFSELRKDAKSRFAAMLSGALSAYTKANAGQLPADSRQLKPYFETPVDDALLDRYEMLQTGDSSGARRGWLMAERAPVDEEFDTRFYISTSGTQGSDVRAYLRTNGIPARP